MKRIKEKENMKEIYTITQDSILPVDEGTVILEKGEKIIIHEARNNSTHKCPSCGHKYLDATGYCVSCKKKVKKKEARRDRYYFRFTALLERPLDNTSSFERQMSGTIGGDIGDLYDVDTTTIEDYSSVRIPSGYAHALEVTGYVSLEEGTDYDDYKALPVEIAVQIYDETLQSLYQQNLQMVDIDETESQDFDESIIKDGWTANKGAVESLAQFLKVNFDSVYNWARTNDIDVLMSMPYLRKNARATVSDILNNTVDQLDRSKLTTGFKESRLRERITVKVTFSDGDYLITKINTDLEGAKKYYLGNTFNLGQGERDKMVKAVKVEPVRESKLKEEFGPAGYLSKKKVKKEAYSNMMTMNDVYDFKGRQYDIADQFEITLVPRSNIVLISALHNTLGPEEMTTREFNWMYDYIRNNEQHILTLLSNELFDKGMSPSKSYIEIENNFILSEKSVKKDGLKGR